MVRLTALGKQVQLGKVNWLDYSPPERWVGGVHIAADQSPGVVNSEGVGVASVSNPLIHRFSGG